MNISPQQYEGRNSRPIKAAEKLIERIVAQNSDKKYDIIVDIGCGTGNGTELLDSHLNVGHIYGIDIDENMIEFAKQNHMKDNISYIAQDFGVEFECMAPEVKALEGKVSLIFANTSLHWILNRKMLAQTLNRLLTKGGKVFAYIHCIPNQFINMSEELKAIHGKAFMAIPEPQEQYKEWLNAFKSTGFSVISNEFHDSEKTTSLKNFMKVMEMNVSEQMLYFIGTDVERQRFKGELPSMILSNYGISTDGTTGEEMLKHKIKVFLFIIEK